jgi:hypothetical protein
MPFGDRTGPEGFGPMTGRGVGFCTGSGVPGNVNPGFGRGFGGRGRNGGRGWRNWIGAAGLTGLGYAFRSWPRWGEPQAFAAPTRDQELGALKAQARQFESALGDIRKRIDDLEAKPGQE